MDRITKEMRDGPRDRGKGEMGRRAEERKIGQRK